MNRQGALMRTRPADTRPRGRVGARWVAPLVALAAALGGPGLLGHAGAAPDPICGTGTPGSGATPGTATCTYTLTNGEQTFIVPSWVSSVHVVAIGAPGGGSGGGSGDQVSADLGVGTGQPLAAGATLYVEVGGPGGLPGGAVGGAGGFNGGASGGSSASGTISGSGGGGGGASDVRTISTSNAATTLAARLLVAGGGGGGGGQGAGTAQELAGLAAGGPGGGGTGGNSATSSAGGTGGTATSTDPQDSNVNATGDGGGGGAGGISGGAGSTSGGGASAFTDTGFALSCGISDAGNGTNGTGGRGSDGCSGTLDTGGVSAGSGGGGGGGVTGGGGGNSGGFACASPNDTPPLTLWCAVGGGGGGGGGSSLVPPGGTATTPAAGTAPQVIITYSRPAPQVGTPSVSATEGAALTGVVATFTTLNPTDTFSATIAWGDGTTSAGTVASTGTGTFNVTGSHTYAEEGAYPLVVTVADQTDATSGQATGTATVADAALTITQSIVAVPGGRPVALAATFTDADPQGTATDYQATLAWGDGTATAGTVAKNPLGAGFVAGGVHRYAHKGTYTISLTVTDQGGSRAAVTKTVVVH